MDKLSNNKVALLSGAGVFAILVLVFLYLAFVKEPWTEVMTSSNPEVIDKATTELRKQAILSQYDEASGILSVRASDLVAARGLVFGNAIEVASEPGYDLFNESSFGVTDFEQQVNLKRALEGELANNIQALAGVSMAKVLIALPEKNLFSAPETASASVTIWGLEGQVVAPDTIQGIKVLVAGAVNGLASDAVSIFNAQGQQLDSVEQINSTTNIESELTEKSEKILRSIPEVVNVQVITSVLVDHTSTRTAEEQWLPLPDGQNLLSKVSNSQLEDGEPASNSTEERYVFNKRVTETDAKKPGGIDRISAAVTVTTSYESNLSAEQIEPLLKAAIGFNSDRGDTLAVFVQRQAEVVMQQVETSAQASEVVQTEPVVSAAEQLASTATKATNEAVPNVTTGFSATMYLWISMLSLAFLLAVVLLLKRHKPVKAVAEGGESIDINMLLEKWENDTQEHR